MTVVNICSGCCANLIKRLSCHDIHLHFLWLFIVEQLKIRKSL
jgi:hypothetical protein